MSKKEIETTKFFLISWLSAAERQCEGFLRNVGKIPFVNNDFHTRRMFDEHYVLTATVMAVRFAKQLVHHAPVELVNQLNAFISATKDAVDIRDMREHSDECFMKKWRKQEQFLRGSDSMIWCDMSSSIQDHRGYMLGNLIAMESIQAECKKLLEHM